MYLGLRALGVLGFTCFGSLGLVLAVWRGGGDRNGAVHPEGFHAWQVITSTAYIVLTTPPQYVEPMLDSAIV